MLPVNISTWQDKKHGINTSINSILTPKLILNWWSPIHPWEKKVPLVDKEKRTLPLAGIKPEDTNPSTNLQVVWLKVMVPDTTSVAKSNALAKLVHHDQRPRPWGAPWRSRSPRTCQKTHSEFRSHLHTANHSNSNQLKVEQATLGTLQYSWDANTKS